MIHELKTWPQFFQPLLESRKTFELRRNDRSFKVGDLLHLREFIPESETYTGRELRATITYVLDGSKVAGMVCGLRDGYVALALSFQVDEQFTDPDEPF